MSIKDVTGVSITPTYPRFQAAPIKRRAPHVQTAPDKRGDRRETSSFLQNVKKFIQLFSKQQERPFFPHEPSYEKLILRSPSQDTTYAKFPPYWPETKRKEFDNFPGLIAKRDLEKIQEASFNQKLLAQLRAPMKGRLMMSPTGTLYFKLPERLVQSALQFIDSVDGPLSERSHEGSFGSHIRILLPNEIRNSSIEEIGEEFYFSLRGCFISSSNKESEAWLLSIDCPALEKIRHKYGARSSLQSSDACSLALLLGLKTRSEIPSEKSLLAALSGGYFLVNPAVQPA